MRVPITVVIGVVLAIVGILGYVLFGAGAVTVLSMKGQDFVSQASTDANGIQTFENFDSGNTVIIVDEVVRMQHDHDKVGTTSVWVDSIGKQDDDIRFVCGQDYRSDFDIGSKVVITLEITQDGQSEEFTCDIVKSGGGRLSTTTEYILVGLIFVGVGIMVSGFYFSRGSKRQPAAQDDWGFDKPAAPMAPPMAPPQAMMPPSEAAIPQPAPVSPPAPPLQPVSVPSTMTITVPPGVVPGQVLTVTMPNGQVVNVEVPPGSSSGSQFTITVKQ